MNIWFHRKLYLCNWILPPDVTKIWDNSLSRSALKNYPQCLTYNVTINVRFRGECLDSIKCAFLAVNVVTINVRFRVDQSIVRFWLWILLESIRGERLVSIKCAFLAVNVVTINQRWTFSFNQMCVSGCERFVIFNVRFSHIFSMLNQTLDNLSLRLFGQLIFSVNSLWIHLKQMRSILSLLLLLPLTLSYAQLSNLRKSSGNYNCWIFLWQLFVKSWCYSLSNSYCIFF